MPKVAFPKSSLGSKLALVYLNSLLVIHYLLLQGVQDIKKKLDLCEEQVYILYVEKLNKKSKSVIIAQFDQISKGQPHTHSKLMK